MAGEFIVVGSAGRIGADMARMLKESGASVLRSDPSDPTATLPPAGDWFGDVCPAGCVIWYLACSASGWKMTEEEAREDYQAANNAIFSSIGKAKAFIFASTPWVMARPLVPYAASKLRLIEEACALTKLDERLRFIADPVGAYFRKPENAPEHVRFMLTGPEDLFERWIRLTQYAVGDWAATSVRPSKAPTEVNE